MYLNNIRRGKLIFDIVGQNFFKVFASKDREINYALLVRIYELFNNDETVISIEREILVNCINEFWEVRQHAEIVDEDDLDITEKSDADKTNAKIRLFVRCNWLDVETENFKQLYSLNDGASVILKAMQELEAQEISRLEYTGFVATTYKLLKDFDYAEGIGTLEQVHKATIDLMSSLRTLNSTIKKYIDELLKNKKMTPDEIMDNVLYKYNDQVVMRAFRNINTVDNPYRYSTDIINYLDRLKDYNNIPKLIDNYMKVKYSGKEKTDDLLLFAESEIYKKINYVKHQYENISNILDEIDKKNNKYLKSARKKMEFIMNNTKDIEGEIVSILRNFKDIEDDKEFEIALYKQDIVSNNSLYTPRKRKTHIESYTNSVPEYDEKRMEECFKELFKEDEYSIYKINSYVDELLKGKEILKLCDIPIADDNELFKLFLVELYGNDKEASYSIDYKEEYISKNGYRIKDFEIAKEKNYYGK